jgi:hypothetical protein
MAAEVTAQSWIRNEETGKMEPSNEPTDAGVAIPGGPVLPGTFRKVKDEIPLHQASLRSQWGTPLARSLTTWGGTSVFVYSLLEGVLSGVLHLNIPRPGLWALLVGFFPGAYNWDRDLDFFSDALYQVRDFAEEVLNQDLDGDGNVGKPETISAEVIEKGRGPDGPFERYYYGDIEISREKARLVARAVNNGTHSFSRDGLSNILTQPEYRKFAVSLEKMGLLVTLPNNHRELTAAGKVWMKRAAK